MKDHLLYLISLSVILWSVSGCTEAVRYTPEEISGYSPAMQEHIKNQEIVVGMTIQQVRNSWGPPSVVNTIQPLEDGRLREEWIYSRKLGIFKTRLIFTAGRLTEIISTDPGGIK